IEPYSDFDGIPSNQALKKQNARSGFSYQGSFHFQRCSLLWLTCRN
ncbi:unnamed protein product, partial [Rotaria sp. Silwood1]